MDGYCEEHFTTFTNRCGWCRFNKENEMHSFGNVYPSPRRPSADCTVSSSGLGDGRWRYRIALVGFGGATIERTATGFTSKAAARQAAETAAKEALAAQAAAEVALDSAPVRFQVYP